MTTLSLEGPQLALGAGDDWERQWCAAEQRDNGSWDLGNATTALLPPEREARRDNRYSENLEAGPKFSALELFCLQAGEMIGFGGDEIDLVVGAYLDDAMLARVLGVLEALGHRPRFLLPRALLAARGQPRGVVRILEMGRDRSFVSTVSVCEDRVRLDRTDAVASASLCGLLEEWLARVTAAFAEQHRFNILHNLGENRRHLYTQLCADGTSGARDMELECGGYRIRLPAEDWSLPLPSWLAGDARPMLLPLPDPLPFSPESLGLDSCATPLPSDLEEVAAQLETGEAARRFDELPA